MPHKAALRWRALDRPAAAVEVLIVLVAGHGLLRPAGRVASGGDGHGQDALAGRGRDDGVEAAIEPAMVWTITVVLPAVPGWPTAMSTVAPGAVFPLTVAWVCWVVGPGSWLARMSSVIAGAAVEVVGGSPPRRVP